MPTNTRIDINGIITEFGEYTRTHNREIFREILAPSNVEKYMTTKRGVRGIYEMQRAELDEITQAFQNDWTPKGQLAFDPSTIIMRRMKVDLPFIVDDIFSSYLAWLYDKEEGERANQFISKFMIEEVQRKGIEDRGRIAVLGEYVAPVIGQPNPALNAADGVLKILQDYETNATANIVAAGNITTNPFDTVLAFIRSFKKHILRACDNRIFTSMEIIDMVVDDWQANNAYKDPVWVGGDDYGIVVPNTGGVKLIGLEHFENSTRLFTTPKWNFLRLIDDIDDIGKIELQTEKRVLNLLMDYSAAWGFGFGKWVWMAETNNN
jgi:hypothetical protein